MDGATLTAEEWWGSGTVVGVVTRHSHEVPKDPECGPRLVAKTLG
jgi:hypothetical protein